MAHILVSYFELLICNFYPKYFRTVIGTHNDGLKSKPGPKRPRRKFPWNEEFRYFIYILYNL